MPAPRGAPQGGRFLTTHWSLVRAAGATRSADSDLALATLCERYWYPVYAFARRRGHDVEEAQDLVQGFFSHLLEKHTLRSADPDRGRFRSFLLGAFKYYLSDVSARAAAQKRGGGQTLASLDLEDAEVRYRVETDPAERPDRLFEKRWALELLGHARRRLDAEAAAAADPERSRRLAALLTGSGEARYRDVADELGMSEGAVKVAVHRLRKRYGAILREEVAQTVEGEDKVDEELRHLFACLE